MGNLLLPQQTPRYNLLKQSLGDTTSNYLIQGRSKKVMACMTKKCHQIYLSFTVRQCLLPTLLLTNEDVWLVNTSVIHLYNLEQSKSNFSASDGL